MHLFTHNDKYRPVTGHAREFVEEANIDSKLPVLQLGEATLAQRTAKLRHWGGIAERAFRVKGSAKAA